MSEKDSRNSSGVSKHIALGGIAGLLFLALAFVAPVVEEIATHGLPPTSRIPAITSVDLVDAIKGGVCVGYGQLPYWAAEDDKLPESPIAALNLYEAHYGVKPRHVSVFSSDAGGSGYIPLGQCDRNMCNFAQRPNASISGQVYCFPTQ